MGTPRAPGEELSEGAPVPPRRAATVILLRDGDAGPEVLLVQRNPASRFMGGAWVFPGGAVGAGEGEGEAALRAAAVRECREEAGLSLERPEELLLFSRWITPERVRIRFDTWFFLAHAPAGQRARVDGGEIVDARWLTPAAALAAGQTGELLLVFPTVRHLEQLTAFPSVEALMRFAREHEVVPVQPQVVGTGEAARILMPGDPGYGA